MTTHTKANEILDIADERLAESRCLLEQVEAIRRDIALDQRLQTRINASHLFIGGMAAGSILSLIVCGAVGP